MYGYFCGQLNTCYCRIYSQLHTQLHKDVQLCNKIEFVYLLVGITLPDYFFLLYLDGTKCKRNCNLAMLDYLLVSLCMIKNGCMQLHNNIIEIELNSKYSMSDYIGFYVHVGCKCVAVNMKWYSCSVTLGFIWCAFVLQNYYIAKYLFPCTYLAEILICSTFVLNYCMQSYTTEKVYKMSYVGLDLL